MADAKQSGGEVVTAYAPDTVIDYLLLRHQPRFAYLLRGIFMSTWGFCPPFFDRYGPFFGVLVPVS